MVTDAGFVFYDVSEYYKEYSTAARPDLAYRAKLPHILPQGGVAGETEYEHRWTQYCEGIFAMTG